jgi:tellurite resistance protein
LGLFDIFNQVKSAVNKQINPAYSQNKDFLEAVASAAALVAAADGDASPAEQATTVEMLQTHAVLGRIYTANDIKAEVVRAFGRATGASGKAGLVRELGDIPKGSEMASDVLYIAVDVAAAGGTSEVEEKAITRLGEILGVKLPSASDVGF